MAEHLLFATLLGAVHLGTCDGSFCAAITSNIRSAVVFVTV